MEFSHQRSIHESLKEYGRGIAGGLLFSLPLLYTLEIWDVGLILHPARLLLYVLTTFLLLVVYNRYAGLRSDSSFGEVLIDSVEEMGIGLLGALGVMVLLGRVGSDLTMNEALGRVVMEGMTMAIGVSVGTAQLGISDNEQSGGMDGENRKGSDYLGQTAIALCGAILFAANIAPTGEVQELASDLSPDALIVLAIVSLLIGAGVLFFAEFRGSARYAARNDKLRMGREIVTTYAAALIAAGLMLYFFGKHTGDTFHHFVAEVIVVGFPAMLGASAGRLLLQLDS